MEVTFLPVGEAARVLGRDRSGLYKRVRSGQLLTDGQDNLVLLDGALVTSVQELVTRLQAEQASTGALRPVEEDVRVRELQGQILRLEQELQLSRHEQELERSNAAADVTALAEAVEMAHASAARAHEMAAHSAKLIRDRSSRG